MEYFTYVYWLERERERVEYLIDFIFDIWVSIHILGGVTSIHMIHTHRSEGVSGGVGSGRRGQQQGEKVLSLEERRLKMIYLHAWKYELFEDNGGPSQKFEAPLPKWTINSMYNEFYHNNGQYQSAKRPVKVVHPPSYLVHLAEKKGILGILGLQGVWAILV